MIGFAAERPMELEVGGQTGAAYGEKGPERQAQRDGDRDRGWQTRAGNVELPIPKFRTGKNFLSFLELRRPTLTRQLDGEPADRLRMARAIGLEPMAPRWRVSGSTPHT